jgi:nucleotide-binding universal stress UspA family protein
VKSILIPTDFSPASTHAADYILDFFKDTQTPIVITLLNAYLVPHVDGSQIISANDNLKRQINQKLLAEKERLTNLGTNPNITIKTEACLGAVENVIPRNADKSPYGLIAMGKNGGSYIQRISDILKSQNSKTPLLIVYCQAS